LYLEVLAGLGQLAILPEGSAKPEQAVTAVVSGVEVYLPLAGLVDLEKEKERLEKELAELEEEKERLGKKLSNTQFLAKAPEAVVAKEKQKLAAVAEKYGKVSDRLRALLRA
jgi:valyl-tRNA synthetase